MSLYIPENKEYPYPEKTDQHYGTFKMNRGIIFDKGDEFTDGHILEIHTTLFDDFTSCRDDIFCPILTLD